MEKTGQIKRRWTTKRTTDDLIALGVINRRRTAQETDIWRKMVDDAPGYSAHDDDDDDDE